jgi:hypothetical protein
LRDANQNIQVNSVTQNLAVTTSAGGTTVLTLASAHFQILIGTTTQTYQLPDATTLPTGSSWIFDNDSTGNLYVVNAASGAVDTVAPGGYATVFLELNGTTAGTWGRFGMLPNEVNWGTNSADLGNSVITNAVWNGTTIASGYGGTGLTTFSAANNALYSTSSSALAAGTLPVAAGGTGVATLTGFAYGNGTSTFTAATTAQALSLIGTVPVANGGTGATTATANYVFSGPTSGGAAAPSFRALVAADIPSTFSEFASGTKLLFQQTTAPTGWTKVTTYDNYALRIVSGSVSTGGSVAFTTAFASQTPSGTVSTTNTATTATGTLSGSVDGTAISTAQMPAHNHGVSDPSHYHGVSDPSHAHGVYDPSHSHMQSSVVGNPYGGNVNYIGADGRIDQYSGNYVYGSYTGIGIYGAYTGVSVNYASTGISTTNTGSGSSHNHGVTGVSFTGTSHNHTASSSFTGTAINLAVQYVDAIICTKN